MEIINVNALEILDSRGNPTVEVNLTLEDGTEARAAPAMKWLNFGKIG